MHIHLHMHIHIHMHILILMHIHMHMHRHMHMHIHTLIPMHTPHLAGLRVLDRHHFAGVGVSVSVRVKCGRQG